ncbi:podocalyxin [Syngnathus scovelli]|uniref:podocalyxin n=1 Tax=Syngnathus scovelli TaxID=161590 RepID=UPI002110938D|nr:podocalyxin [Syngnathus scovelli]
MAATMRITCLLLSFSLLCDNVHADNATTAIGVTVATDAPTQGMTVATAKVSTVAIVATIKGVVDPVTQKLPTLAPMNGVTVKVTQAPTIPAVVTSLPVTMAAAPKVSPAPTQPQTKVAAPASSAPPTVGKAPLASVITTKASLAVATTGAAQDPNLNVITVTPKGKVSTDGTTATIQVPLRTTAIFKTTQGNVITAGTTATSLQQTSGMTKAAVTGQTTMGSPILASTATPAVTTTSAPPGATSFKRATMTTITGAYPKKFSYSLNNGQEKEEEKDLVEVCKRLMGNLRDGNCTLTWRHHKGKLVFDCVEINGKVKTALATQYYEEITKKPTDNKTLIAILASCGALLIMIIILAVCASHHRKPYNENQQHLTEELHTVENGYHDNPTLEVMEVQPEMQEKKMALNGEFSNDGWIVPIDNMLKEDIPEEEDTHL